MKHIFINEFTEVAFIYDGVNFQELFSYSDYMFLNNYDEYDVCFISPQSETLSQYEGKCIEGWCELLAQKYSKESFTLWFVDKSMRFCPYSGGNDAYMRFKNKEGSHIFVGGKIDDTCDSMSMDEFCKIIIELSSTHEVEQNTDTNQNLQAINEALSELKEKINVIFEHINNVSEEYSVYNELKSELSAYRNDFYLKSVQRLGLDALIEILCSMCARLHSTTNLTDEARDVIRYDIKLVERALNNRFNVQCVYSEIGAYFNEETMVTFPGEFIETENESLKGCVAYSVSPAIYWTIPRVNSGEQKFLYKEESVVLYNN